MRRSPAHQMLLGSALLALATLDVDAILVAWALLGEVPALPADEARRESERVAALRGLPTVRAVPGGVPGFAAGVARCGGRATLQAAASLLRL